MTALPQTDELTRQLHALSIARPAEDSRAKAATCPSSANKPHRRPLVLGLMLILLAGGLAGAGYWLQELEMVKTATSTNPRQEPPRPDTAHTSTGLSALTAQASTAPNATRLVGSGYVLAERESVIGTEIGGRLTELLVAVGDKVQTGQTIARLDDQDARLALEGADLALKSAKADVERLTILRDKTAARAKRLQPLAARGFVRATDAEEADFDRRLAEAEISGAKLAVTRLEVDRDRARDRLERLTVTAPFSGIIVETRAVPGDLVGSSLDNGPVPGIAVLMDPTSLRVEADLAETALAQVIVGQNAEVVLDSAPQKRLSARVAAILPQASRQKGTITLRLHLGDLPHGVTVIPNMAAKVTLLP